ncbi:rap guanine nucleotide exchange factor 2-like [Diaphorina citri]|uniref:Rap guanine nucleotide exchange factor 2-like n=1 Tax=Diaphorina citri TaxID=121845 RepID=A0A3Q0J1L7_DIACI|nr:rap guanine nucleotide exchange factor 2-like [Diaphorina citri]
MKDSFDLETTAHKVVMLALQEFGITEPSSHFYVILHYRIRSGTPDRLMLQLIEENSVIDPTYVEDFLLTHRTFIGTSIEVADQLLQWFRDSQARDRVTRVVLLWVNNHFTDFETDPAMMAFLEKFEAALSAENLTGQLRLLNIACAAKARARNITLARPSRDAALQFHVLGGYERGYGLFISQLVNREMFWVVTEVCSESNLVRRSKVIKQFIKVARQCKECRNFNSMFAIVSGLGHGAVSRLRSSWEKLPSKYQRLFQDLQDLMDPSRNMSKYRQLVSAEQSRPPIVRGQPPSNAMVTLNQLTTGGTAGQMNAATVKRRKKSTGAPNPKKMFEEAQMVRRVKAYLARMNVITDEDKLHALSAECEGTTQAPGSGPLRKRHPSPTLSTASTASSASEGRKPNVQKFGSASPQAVRKLLSLSEPGKTRLHQPRHQTSPSPGAHRRPPPPARLPPSHERCHSDQGGLYSSAVTAPLLSSVDLNAESSSVTSLSNLPLRKTVTSGSVTSTDSGHSTQLDSHSNSSGEVPTGTSPPLTHRRHSMQPPGYSSGRPPFPHAVQVLPPTDDEDDDAQVSAV